MTHRLPRPTPLQHRVPRRHEGHGAVGDSICTRRTAARALLVAAALTAVGCAEVQSPLAPTQYPDTARATYLKGKAELDEENYLEAIKLFSNVKNKYPFSRYATLAELRIADAYFAQDKFLEAIDAYKLFLKFHPTHPQVASGYVSFRIAKGYFKQIPSDWFLLPPSYEKDQGATKDALRYLTAFLQDYPKSRYHDEVQTLQRKAVRRLADHELYVARFYLERGKPKATILRLETLLKRYPAAGVDPEVMLLLGKTYLEMDKKELAQQTFANLVAKYPDDPHSAKARLFLKHLSGQRE